MFRKLRKMVGLGGKKSNKGLHKAYNRFSLQLEYLEAREVPAAFTPGDLVVYRVGDGSAALSSAATSAFLDEYSPTGTLVQSLPVPTAVSGSNQPLTNSGTATSEGALSLSADGQYLTFGGYAATPGTAGIAGTTSTTVARVLGRVDSNGTFNTSTTTTAFSANNIRSVTSTNGTDLWAVGANTGVVYTTLGSTGAGTTVANSTTNLRVTNIANGQLYASSSSGAIRLATIGTGTPTTTGQTITNLPGLPTATGSPYGFAFADLTSTVAGVDTLYVADDVAATGAINKYSLVGGTWVSNGVIGSGTANVRGVTAVVSGSTVTLYATAGVSGAANSSLLYKITDTGGYNAAPSTTSLGTAIATGATNTAFRGVAIVPQAAGNTATTTAITNITPLTNNYGDSVTFTATVTANSGSTAPTAGSVVFTAGAGGTVLATATSSSTSGNVTTFTVTATNVPVGTFNNVVATYSPGTGFNSSTSSAFGSTLSVAGSTTNTTLTVAPTTVTSGQTVTFSGAVTIGTAAGTNNGPATGTVQIRDGSPTGTLLATQALDTSGNYTVTVTPAVGTYSPIAYYLGQNAYIASNSATQSLTVNDITTTGTTLAAGDIAFTGYFGNNSPAASTAERFSFVLLKDVVAGTSVIFTDNGYDGSLSTPAFQRNEAVYVVTFTNAYTAGSRFFYETAPATTTGFKNFDGTQTGLTTQVVGNDGFSNNGDNLFAIQGSLGTPTFLAGISALGFVTTGSLANSTTTTYLPAALAVGTTALTFASNTNGILNASNPAVGSTVTGSVAQIDPIVNTVANWTITGLGTADNTVVPPAVAFSVGQANTVLSLSAASYSIVEGNSGTSTVTITVNRTGLSTNTVTVDYTTAAFTGPGAATAGTDYVATNGTLTFGPGVASQTFTVTINGDTTAELNERFLVNLSNPQSTGGGGTVVLGTATATVAIRNDDATVAFTPGNLLAYRVGDGVTLYGGSGNAASGTSAPIFLDELGSDGFVLQSVAAPASVSDSISATSDGMLSLSADGRLVAFTGYQTAAGTAGVTATTSAAVPRVLGTVNAAGTFDVSTTTSAYSGNNIRSAATVDGKEFWAAGTGSPSGVRYYNQAGVANQAGTIVSNTFNTRTVAFYNGQLYFGTGSAGTFNGGVGIYATGTPIPTTLTGTVDNITVLDPTVGTTAGSPYQFVLADIDNSGTLTSGDKFFFTDDRSAATGGGLYSATYNGVNFPTATLVTSNFTDVFGLTAQVVGGVTTLYGTRAAINIQATGTSSFTTGLVTFTDGTSTSWTPLTTITASGTTGVAVQQYRGVAFVPRAAGATASGLALAASPASAQFGTNVTLTATVTAGVTGFVSFQNAAGAVLATAPIVSGQATYTFNNSILTPNVATTFSAYYGGNDTYAADTQSTTVTATGTQTTTTVGSSNTGVAPVGTNLTITVTVAPASGSLTSANGTVALTLNGAPVSVAPTYGTSGNNLTATYSIPVALLQSFTGGTQVNNLTPGITSLSAAYTPATGDTSIASNSTFNQQVQAAAFGAGNLTVFRAGNGVQSNLDTTGSAVFVDEVTTAGVVVQSIAFPTVTVGALHSLLAQGQQSTDNQVTRSGDGSAIFVAGYESPTGFLATGDVRSVANRTIGRISIGATPTVSSAVSVSGINPAAGNLNLRGVYSPDGTQVYLGGSGGLFYVPSYTTASGAATTAVTTIDSTVNVYSIQQLGSNLLITQNITTPSIGTYSGLPTTTATFTQLTGFPTTQTWTAGSATGDPSRLMQPFFADLSATEGFGGTAFDTIYIGSSQIFDASPLSKYTWSGTSNTWTLSSNVVGVAATTPGYSYLVGSQSGNTVTLYVTHDRGGSSTSDPQSTIYSFVDSSGYGGALPTPTVVKQNTAATNPNQYYRGITAITAAANNPPTITSNGGGASASISVAENTTAVTTVTATDPDSGQTISYSIVGGADAARFSINSTSGVLTFNAAPDFETPTDAGANNVYDVIVQAADNFSTPGTDTQAIAVTVTDVAAGTLTFVSAPYTITEGNSGTSTATITVSRSGGTDATSVTYATSDGSATAGSDYVTASGTLSWAVGDSANKTFTVTVNGDTTFESNETVNLTLSAPTAGATIGSPNPTTLTITNDDASPNTYQFSAATYTTAEGVGSFLITVTRTDGSATGSVTLNTANGTATAPGDYTAQTNVTVSFGVGQTTATVAIPIVDDGSGEASETFTAALTSPTGGTLGTIISAAVTITDPILVVQSLTPTTSGVFINFNRAIDPTTLNLYDGSAGALGAADVTVTGTSVGAVSGTLIVTPAAQAPNGRANQQLYFIRTGGALAVDAYNVTLRSAANGLKDAAGVLLDGDTNGTAGGDYNPAGAEFTVASPSQPLLFSLGDVTRGPTQSLGTALVPAGIPLTLSNTVVNGNGITGYDVRFVYDPTLFTPTGFTSTVAGFSGAFNANFATLADGRKVAALAVANSSALPGTGGIQLATIQGTVPAAAPYFGKGYLSIVTTPLAATITSNGLPGFVPASTVFDNTTQQDVVIRGEDAVQVVSYFGDVNGSGTITSGDASLVLQLSVGQGTGFTFYQNADPVLIADANGSNTITSGDASLLLQKSVGLTVPQIPDSGPAISNTGGPDPRISIADATGAQGDTVEVSVNFLATEVITPGLNSLQAAISWDPNKLQLSSTALGTYLASLSGWGAPTTNVDNANGTLRIAVATSNPEGTTALNAGGQALKLNFTVVGNAPVGPTRINLRQNVATTATGAENNNGLLTLIPAPTNADTDSVDATFTITAAAQASATLFVANVAASAGATFTAPVRVQFNNATATAVASYNLAISFDPTKLQVSGAITLGALLTTAGGYGAPTVNLDNNAGTIRIAGATSSPTNFTAGTVGDLVNIPFTVAPTASGTSYINIAQFISPTTSSIEYQGGLALLPLSPAPTNGTADSGIDSVVTIALNPNDPPFNTIPAAQQYLTKPGAGGTDLVFSTANGNAIQVSDPDAAGSNLRVTLTVANGTLALNGTTGLTVTGNGTGTLVATGTVAALNAALNGLTFTPTAGFFGTTNIVVNTNDLGNSGFGGPTFDIDSVAVTPVGVRISELKLDTPVLSGATATRSGTVLTVTAANHGLVVGQRITTSGFTVAGWNGSFVVTAVVNANSFRYTVANSGGTSGTGGLVQSPTQYVEVFSTLPNYTLPSDTYLVGIEGDSTENRGSVQDVFFLGGLSTGANGYLLVTQRAEQYGATVGVNSGATVVTQTTGAITAAASQGFGNSAAALHVGGNRPAGQTATNIETGSASFLLVRAPSDPLLSDDIDANDDGTPDGVFAGWATLDSVGVLDGNSSTDVAYGRVTFRNGTAGTAPTAAVIQDIAFNPNYVARVAAQLGANAADWVASVLDPIPLVNPGEYFLGATDVSNPAYASRPLNHIGGVNTWTTKVDVTVNDGDIQRSQITRLTATFSNPSDLPIGWQSKFAVTVGGTPVNLVLTPLDGTDNLDGSWSGVTQVLIRFAPTTGVTYNLANPLTVTGLVGDQVALNDGAYTLTINGTGIIDSFGNDVDANFDGTFGGVGSFSFRRLFGDVSGDGFVSNFDAPSYSAASLAYNGNLQANYLWYFDYNGDGLINSLDDNEFGLRYA